MEDKKIVCRDCKDEFIWSVGEQEFYKQMGFKKPNRCKRCRDKRKQERRDRDK